MLKITLFQSMAVSSPGMPRMAILPPWHMLSSMSLNAWALPDISSPTSKPSLHVQFFLHVGNALPADVDGAGGAQGGRQCQAGVDDIGDHHMARTGVFAHRPAMAPMGPAPVISTSSPSRSYLQGSVYRVAKGVEQGRHIQVDAFGVLPYIGHGQGQVLGEGPGTVNTDAAGKGTQVTPSRHAVAAAAAHHMALAGDDLAGRKSMTLEPTSTISPTNSWPPPWVPGWSSVPRRPSCRCACPYRRWRCAFEFVSGVVAWRVHAPS